MSLSIKIYIFVLTDYKRRFRRHDTLPDALCESRPQGNGRISGTVSGDANAEWSSR